MGNPEANLQRALAAVEALADATLGAVSPLYCTPPWGYTDQPDFLNAVAELRTELPPPVLLHLLLSIEQHLGRERSVPWGPRTLDLDLLCAGQIVCQTPKIQLPHPRLYDRAFVLVPWADIAPNWPVPLPDGGSLTVQALLERLPTEDRLAVRPLVAALAV